MLMPMSHRVTAHGQSDERRGEGITAHGFCNQLPTMLLQQKAVLTKDLHSGSWRWWMAVVAGYQGIGLAQIYHNPSVTSSIAQDNHRLLPLDRGRLGNVPANANTSRLQSTRLRSVLHR